MTYYLSLVAAISLGVVGQIALKTGATGPASVIEQLTHPITIMGLSAYLFAAPLYIVALRQIPLSIAFPSVAASYAAVAVLAHLIWKEPFGVHQISGLLLIGAGIVLLNQHG
jgi:small multidrug resistance pump